MHYSCGYSFTSSNLATVLCVLFLFHFYEQYVFWQKTVLQLQISQSDFISTISPPAQTAILQVSLSKGCVKELFSTVNSTKILENGWLPGTPPISALSFKCKLSNRPLPVAIKLSGMIPVNLLWSNDKWRSLTNFSISGIVPVSWLRPKSSKEIFRHLKLLGMVPVNWLEYRLREPVEKARRRL